jgi:hypothetical protein
MCASARDIARHRPAISQSAAVQLSAGICQSPIANLSGKYAQRRVLYPAFQAVRLADGEGSAVLQSVLTVARNAAEILSASCAMTTTSLIHA